MHKINAEDGKKALSKYLTLNKTMAYSGPDGHWAPGLLYHPKYECVWDAHHEAFYRSFQRLQLHNNTDALLIPLQQIADAECWYNPNWNQDFNNFCNL